MSFQETNFKTNSELSATFLNNLQDYLLSPTFENHLINNEQSLIVNELYDFYIGGKECELSGTAIPQGDATFTEKKYNGNYIDTSVMLDTTPFIDKINNSTGFSDLALEGLGSNLDEIIFTFSDKTCKIKKKIRTFKFTITDVDEKLITISRMGIGNNHFYINLSKNLFSEDDLTAYNNTNFILNKSIMKTNWSNKNGNMRVPSASSPYDIGECGWQQGTSSSGSPFIRIFFRPDIKEEDFTNITDSSGNAYAIEDYNSLEQAPLTSFVKYYLEQHPLEIKLVSTVIEEIDCTYDGLTLIEANEITPTALVINNDFDNYASYESDDIWNNITSTLTTIGNINKSLDNIISIQESLIGGE